MPNKKIWAYAKNPNNEFIMENGRMKLFFIWSVLKMKKLQTLVYNTVTFWSTQREETKRKIVTPVKTGFFRYVESHDGSHEYSGDGESLSHSIAILALSQLSEIPFTIGSNKYVFKFSELRAEDLKIEFETGNYYYPDLFGFFSEPQYFVEKWGGKVAIEVKVSHGCEDIKIREFEDHNIPIIEITLNENMQFLKELRNEPFDEDDLEDYYNFISDKFKKNVYGRILSNPMMIHFQKKVQQGLTKQIESLQVQNKAMIEGLKHHQKTNSFLQSDVNSLKGKWRTLTDQNNNLQVENKKLKNKTFTQKLSDLLNLRT